MDDKNLLSGWAQLATSGKMTFTGITVGDCFQISELVRGTAAAVQEIPTDDLVIEETNDE